MLSDRSYYRRSANILRLMKYLILILLAVFFVVSLTVYREDITADNFRYLMKYIDFRPPDLSEGEKSINYSSSVGAVFSYMNDKLLIADDDNVSSYDLNGIRLLNEDLRYNNPAVEKNGKYLLVYDQNGTGISVFNSFSRLCGKTADTPITCAYLDASGGFAYVTAEKSYTSGFVVYDDHFKRCYSYMERGEDITDVCCDLKKHVAACVITGVEKGDFRAELRVFDMTSDADTPIASPVVYGELPLRLFCADDSIVLITDRGIHTYSLRGEPVNDTDFGYDTVQALYRFDDGFAIVKKAALAGTATVLSVYGFDGTEVFSQGFDGELLSVSMENGRLCVLEPGQIRIFRYDGTYTFSGEDSSPYICDGEYKHAFVFGDDGILVVSDTGAAKIGDTGKADTSSADEEGTQSTDKGDLVS